MWIKILHVISISSTCPKRYRPTFVYYNLTVQRKHLNILSFEETIFIHIAKVMYKIANNAAPNLTDLVQMRGNGSNLNDSQINLRPTSNKNFLIPKPKTNLFKSSFLNPVL